MTFSRQTYSVIVKVVVNDNFMTEVANSKCTQLVFQTKLSKKHSRFWIVALNEKMKVFLLPYNRHTEKSAIMFERAIVPKFHSV